MLVDGLKVKPSLLSTYGVSLVVPVSSTNTTRYKALAVAKDKLRALAVFEAAPCAPTAPCTPWAPTAP